MARRECPCVIAERPVCSEGQACRHFSNKGICRNCHIGRREREARLIAVIEHMRLCSECAETDVLNCSVGKELWAAAGLPPPQKVPRD